jgi:AAA family ATP:ADP antiporter
MSTEATALGETRKDTLLHKILRLFTVIYPGETTKAFLLTINSFLIMFGYYQIKAIRNGLLLAAHPAQMQSYLAIPQAILLIFVVWIFSRVASKYSRHLLITYVTLFCMSNLVLFWLMNLAGVPVSVMGIVFFIWIGMYNLLIPAQFWGFANDIYSEDAGKRLFPMIAFGATLGGVLGPQVAKRLIPIFGSYGMMLVTTAILGLCIMMTWIIHAQDVREEHRVRVRQQDATPAKKVKEQPLSKSGGFRLVFKNHYLLLIALVMGLYNFINSLGEVIYAILQQRVAMKALGVTAATGGAALQNYISQAFAGYQGLANLLAMLIQLFLVSRIFRWVGVSGGLLFFPIISLLGYGYAAFGASLLMMKWIKSAENGIDYSLMKTTRSALFLITKRDEKYKAQAAIETFFVRGGDALQAVVVYVGTTILALSIEHFAMINAACVFAWLFLSILIVRQYKVQKAKFEASPPEA